MQFGCTKYLKVVESLTVDIIKVMSMHEWFQTIFRFSNLRITTKQNFISTGVIIWYLILLRSCRCMNDFKQFSDFQTLESQLTKTLSQLELLSDA